MSDSGDFDFGSCSILQTIFLREFEAPGWAFSTYFSQKCCAIHKCFNELRVLDRTISAPFIQAPDGNFEGEQPR